MAVLAFLGTPDAAVPCLRGVVEAGHDVRLVVSQPDRRRGRGGAVVPSPVKRAATELGLAVSDSLDDVPGCGANLGVVVAYGRIIPQRVLDVVPMVNVHFSLLPRWRGAAPVERAVLAGDAITGVSLMRLDAGLDTGPVLGMAEVVIGDGETVTDLTARLADLGARMLVDALDGADGSLGPGVPQQGEPTYAAKISPDELRIDWRQPASVVVRLTRLGRAYTEIRGRRIRILRAEMVAGPAQGPGHGAAAGEGHGAAAGEGHGAAAGEGHGAAAGEGHGAAAGEGHGAAAGEGHGAAAGEGHGAAAGEGHGAAAGEGPGTLVAVAQVVSGDGGRVRLVTVQPEGRRPVDGDAWWNGIRPLPGERLGLPADTVVGGAGTTSTA